MSAIRNKYTGDCKIYIPLDIQEMTIMHIRRCGLKNEEGFVAWSGVRANSKLVVKRAIVPNESETNHHNSVRFSDTAIESIADTILSRGELLIAQVHSHPFEAFHSDTDDKYPLLHRKGFLSLVIPYFGKYGFDNFGEFRVFEYIQDNSWTQLTPATIKKRFILEKRSRWNRLSTIKNFILERKRS
jgi:hypothetical protein